ncbi:MAG: PAS domain S-box protein [Planctomycetota bacterium]|nr:PAS domain S-box protein [Planctomycetota bacterium]
MAKKNDNNRRCSADIAQLKARLAEAEEALRAIRNGEVDALVVSTPVGDQVFTLQGAEHAYRVIVETMGEGALTLKPDGGILYCNARFADIVGHPIHSIIGVSLADFVAPEHRLLIADLLSDAAGVSTKAEVMLQSPDGSPVPVHVSAAPLGSDGEPPPHVCLVVTDLRAVKEAEESRRRSESQLAAIVTSSHDAILSVSPDGMIQTWNGGAQRLYGYSPEEAFGRPVTILAPPERHAEIVGILVKVRRGERAELQRTVRIRKDGRSFQAAVAVSPIRDAGGKVSGASWICRDITKELETEAVIMAAAEGERQRIGRDLHDSLGQQLTGMTFLCKLLEKRLVEKAKPLASEAAAIVQLASKALIESKALSRGLCPLAKGPEALMSGLNELAASAKVLYGATCRFRCPRPVLVHNETASMHLYRIAQEAVANAARHGQARFVRINLFCKQTDKGQCTLRIVDDGKGFPATPAKKKGKGLDIMAYRARTIGGTLKIESRPRRGTVVECTFPAGQA